MTVSRQAERIFTTAVAAAPALGGTISNVLVAFGSIRSALEFWTVHEQDYKDMGNYNPFTKVGMFPFSYLEFNWNHVCVSGLKTKETDREQKKN